MTSERKGCDFFVYSLTGKVEYLIQCQSRELFPTGRVSVANAFRGKNWFHHPNATHAVGPKIYRCSALQCTSSAKFA